MPLKRAVFLDRDGVINQTVQRRGAARAPQDFSEFAWVDGSAGRRARLRHPGAEPVEPSADYEISTLSELLKIVRHTTT